MLNITGHEMILSLPYIHRLSKDNLNYIKEVKDNIAIGNQSALSIGAILLFCIVGVGIFWYRRQAAERRNSQEINNILESLKATEDGRSPRGGVVNP